MKINHPELCRDSFLCTQCAECCSGNASIFLNLFDLYNLAMFMKVAGTKELFQKNLVEFFPGENGLSLPRIKFRKKPVQCCPFLVNEQSDDGRWIGKCILHEGFKPLVCAIAPAAVFTDFESNITRFEIVRPDPDCTGVLVDDQSYLNRIQNDFRLALIYNERYLKILDAIVDDSSLKQKCLPDIFMFKITSGFQEILAELESRCLMDNTN